MIDFSNVCSGYRNSSLLRLRYLLALDQPVDVRAQVRDEFGITILFVTHDIDESVYLSDRVVVLTHSPTEVKEVIPVAMPKPRDQIATKELAEFARLRAHVYRLIKREQAVEDAQAPVPASGTTV